MKTTEMILKVKEASNVTILSVRGTVILWDSMRDLGHTLYTLVDMVQEDSGLYRLFERADGSIVLATVAYSNIVGDYKISYPLEFDGFGELENWSHVSEEDATQLLTKAPAEPAKVAGTNQLNHLFNQLGLNFKNWYCNSYDNHVAEFLHNDDTELSVLVRFNEGTVDLYKDDMCEAVKRFTITLVPEESNEPSTAPDQRTGHEVKAS